MSKPHPRLNSFAIILFISVNFISDMYILSVPTLASYWHINQSWMQQSMTIFIIGMAFALIAVGAIIEIFTTMHVLIFVYLLCIIGTLLAALLPYAAPFFLARFIQGLGAGGMIVLAKS